MCMGKCRVCRGIDERACVVIVCVLVCMCRCCVQGWMGGHAAIAFMYCV